MSRHATAIVLPGWPTVGDAGCAASQAGVVVQRPLSTETFSHLVGLIYDCALDPGRWPDTLTRLRNELEFANAAMTLQALPAGDILLNVLVGPGREWVERGMHYGPEVIDQWGGLETILSLPLDEPVVLSRLRDRSLWEDNRYYREWGRPQGIYDVMAVPLTRDAGALGSVAFGRHDTQGEIGNLELEATRLFIPHLQRAIAISRLLDIKSVAAATFEDALDAFAVAVVLTDGDLHIIHANAAARVMLSARDPISSDRGILALTSRMLAGALGKAVRQAAEDEAALGRRGMGIPVSRADGTPCIINILPLQRGTLRRDLSQTAVAAVFIAPATSPRVASPDVLAALYDLTAAEARVFAEIVSGRTKKEIAKALRVEVTTIKTHLSHVFLKTGTRRQADLVALNAALALPVGYPDALPAGSN